MPRVGDMYPERWMKAHHLEEMDPDAEHCIFTIQSTGETTFGDGKKQIVLRFAESRLELGLNKGNAEMCEELFGSDDSDDWIGQKLALHVEVVKNTMAPGGKSNAVRVSSKATKLANKPAKSTKKPAPPVTQEEVDDIPDDLPF